MNNYHIIKAKVGSSNLAPVEKYRHINDTKTEWVESVPEIF
jgi:hypothetical protein